MRPAVLTLAALMVAAVGCAPAYATSQPRNFGVRRVRT
jgi:hypothetical protein